jgi:hypothetical protein
LATRTSRSEKFNSGRFREVFATRSGQSKRFNCVTVVGLERLWLREAVDQRGLTVVGLRGFG